MSGEKIDIFKRHKAEYKAGKKPALVQTTRGMYLAVDGQGAPGSDGYLAAIAAMYGMAYTIKMGRKSDGKGDYTIGKLEGLYWGDEGADLDPARMESWCWRLLIRTPEEVAGFVIRDADLDLARARLREKKKDTGADLVKLEYLEEGLCVQMMHVGSYESEGESLALIQAFCAAEQLTAHLRHHEVYLSDPRRVAPENLKTILRMPVR